MKYSRKLMLLGILLVSMSISSCTKKFLDSDLERAINDNEKEIVAYTQQRNLKTTKTTSGIHYVITKTNSTGKSPQLGEQVVAYYKLNLLNGSVIDSVTAQGGKPFKFGFYGGLVFDGFLESVSLLKEGEKGTFLIPSSLAFQNQQITGIPAWSVIKAEIEIVEYRNEERQIDVFVAEKGYKNVTITQTGLRFIPVDSTLVPNGAVLTDNDEVVLSYRGTLLNNAEFDKGELTLRLGSNTVIKGFEEGVRKMKVGEKATVIFPSSIGYGKAGTSSILPYSPLLFELEILSKR